MRLKQLLAWQRHKQFFGTLEANNHPGTIATIQFSDSIICCGFKTAVLCKLVHDLQHIISFLLFNSSNQQHARWVTPQIAVCVEQTSFMSFWARGSIVGSNFIKIIFGCKAKCRNLFVDNCCFGSGLGRLYSTFVWEIIPRVFILDTDSRLKVGESYRCWFRHLHERVKFTFY